MSSPEIRVGNNSEITLHKDTVHKVTKHTYSYERAIDLAEQLNEYAAQFSDESVDVPELTSVGIKQSDINPNLYHVEHTLQLISGPNLCSLQGEKLEKNTEIVLGQVASMSMIGRKERLRLPFDATSQNFHIEQGRGVMVDLFPPLSRHANGSFPLENVQYSYPASRRRMIPYTRGTLEGALMQVLFTAALGDRPQAQGLEIFRQKIEWCHDVIPESVSQHIRSRLHQEISRSFLPHFLRMGVADGVCAARRMLGIKPYK